MLEVWGKKAHFFVLFAFSLELAGNLLGFAVEKKKSGEAVVSLQGNMIGLKWSKTEMLWACNFQRFLSKALFN